MPRKLPLPKGNEKVWYDLLPTEAAREPGRHIYLFRNTKTNQILYSLFPKIQQRTLQQLPFLGKHSVPPRVRPDMWTAHCRVGPFPTAKQGHDAFKRLREFRKLHEYSWDVTNPEWKGASRKKRVKLIMGQRENASADLARVLEMQEELGQDMEEKRAERLRLQEEFMEKRWAKLEAQAKSVEDGKIKELQQKINDCKSNLGNAKDDAEETSRLRTKTTQIRREIKEHLWAQQIVAEKNAEQEKIDVAYGPKLREYETAHERLLNQGKHEEAAELERPSKPANKIRQSILPRALSPLPEPYTIDGVECHWADLYDAYYAKEWPDAIVQDTLAYVEKKRVTVFTHEEYKEKLKTERAAIRQQTTDAIQRLREKAKEKQIQNDIKLLERHEKQVKYNERKGLPPPEPPKMPRMRADAARARMAPIMQEPAQQPPVQVQISGFSKYVPAWMTDIKNPFRSASA